MRKIITPSQYQPKLDLLNTQIAIKYVKDTFEKGLAKQLSLIRVSAPLFVDPISGLNDGLNGIERAVGFDILDLNSNVEIVQSLAKWKRYALNKYQFKPGTGLYTDMNAIRRDEELDNIHSVYVDQWDWEKIISSKDRNLDFLKKTVNKIYKVLLDVEEKINKKYPVFSKKLPDQITFITSEELLLKYPDLTSKQREDLICQEHKAVFITKIGWPLSNGVNHDNRASDYDDWNLNGDILVWDQVLNCGLEISSMGIRVDSNSLTNQINYKGEIDKFDNQYTKAILNNQLPLTIGGGIGQSRLCMFFLEKAHIGEVQVSTWSQEDIDLFEKFNIKIL